MCWNTFYYHRLNSNFAFENYLYSVRNTLKDEKFKDKFKPDEKSKIESTLDTLTKWFETNGEASVKMMRQRGRYP